VRVAIIGAGFSGIAAGAALRRAGIEDFVIFESAPGIGGTWWYNRYPGAEVDLESHIYSYSFARADWSGTHVGWRELQAYLEQVALAQGLWEHIRFSSTVASAQWREGEGYTVTTTAGESELFTAVISAVGFLNIPLVPPFARDASEFRGVVCHTSRWLEDIDMTGKDVAVVGTGSSAVQIVAEATRVARSVKIFQLEPNWILPKNSRRFGHFERRLNRLTPVYLWRRLRLYVDYDRRQFRSSHVRADGYYNKKRAERARSFLRESLADRPDLLELATPDFAFEARRTVMSDTYYSCLKRQHVTLVPHGVKGLTGAGVLDANGDEHGFDIVVLATGFDAANYLANYSVTGVDDQDLHATWAGEPDAFLGMMVPGFPNFFMMYGPNTNSSPLVHFYESQAAFIADVLADLPRAGTPGVEVKRWAHEAYNDWLQSRLSKTVWATTTSYFTAGTGKIVSQWPDNSTMYRLLTRVARRVALTRR
jgi:cation diffusion facilitator CzcD-associated flavoprotein CzcO